MTTVPAVIYEYGTPNMKTPFACVLAAAAVVSADGALALDRHVTFYNATGAHVEELYGSNNGTTSWEEDLLGDYTLAPDETIEVDFDDGTGYCIFDFLVVMRNGNQFKKEDVNVCEVGYIEIQ